MLEKRKNWKTLLLKVSPLKMKIERKLNNFFPQLGQILDFWILFIGKLFFVKTVKDKVWWCSISWNFWKIMIERRLLRTAGKPLRFWTIFAKTKLILYNATYPKLNPIAKGLWSFQVSPPEIFWRYFQKRLWYLWLIYENRNQGSSEREPIYPLQIPFLFSYRQM